MNILDQFASLSRAMNVYSSQPHSSNEILQHRDNAMSMSEELTTFAGALTRSLAIRGPSWVPSPSDTLRPYSNRCDVQSAHSLTPMASREETLPSQSRARIQAPRKVPSTHGVPKFGRDCSPKILPLEKISSTWPRERKLIERFMKKTASEATKDQIRHSTEDPRVVDLKVPHPTQEVKFRGMLGKRSLALEFDYWQLDEKKVSKVDLLFQKLTGQSDTISSINLSSGTPPLDNCLKRVGHITEFLRSRGGFVDIAAARNGIDQGVRLLVLEKMYGKAAISSFMSFATAWFRKLLGSDIAQLASDMKAIPWIDELINARAEWFIECECKYSETC